MQARISKQLSNKQNFWAVSFTGEVIQADRRTLTHVHEAPGHSMGAKGYIPGPVYSSHSTLDEVWLRDDQGREHRYSSGKVTVPMRLGHRVTVLWGGAEHQSDGHYVGIHNHSTGERICSIQKFGAERLKSFGVHLGLGGHLLGWTVASAIVSAAFGVASQWSRWERAVALPDWTRFTNEGAVGSADTLSRILERFGGDILAHGAIFGGIGALCGLVLGAVFGVCLSGIRRIAKIEREVNAFFVDALNQAVHQAIPAAVPSPTP